MLKLEKRDRVPKHWEEIHKKRKHSEPFNSGKCEECLNLFHRFEVIPVVVR